MGADQTSASLLLRIRNRQDGAAWEQFTTIYTPIVQAYALKAGVPPQELDDLAQEVLMAVAASIGQFHYDPQRGRFRSWLYEITRHRVLRWREAAQKPGVQVRDSDLLKGIEDSDADLSVYWEEQWRQRIFSLAIAAARDHFEPRTFEAFRRFALLGQPAVQVAAALGMTLNHVYVCKSRVLDRLREEVEAMDGAE